MSPEEFRKHGESIINLAFVLLHTGFVSARSDKNIIDRSPVSTTKDSQVEHEGFEHFLNNIKETHPDSQEIANNPVFKKYINSLPGNKYIKTLHKISRTDAERILEDCTTEGTIQLISNYKSQEDFQESHRLIIIMMSVKR